ncbi:Cysteine desulfurase IscS [bioreactor metagenome]|uniref:Cysteine desulfurase IscS n=1 Tax=bioreactor metagenome TaxID=1076179 RepID=A0A645IZ70_9ZZZZ
MAANKIYNEIDENFNKVLKLKTYFTEKLKELEDVRINSEGSNFLPYILSVSFSGVKGEVLLYALEDNGIYVSKGSACSSKLQGKNYVLEGFGLKEVDINSTIRFSFSAYNSKNEVDYVIETLDKSLKFLRRMKR